MLYILLRYTAFFFPFAKVLKMQIRRTFMLIF